MKIFDMPRRTRLLHLPVSLLHPGLFTGLFCLLLLLDSVVVACAIPPGKFQTLNSAVELQQADTSDLKPDQSLERELASGETHAYRIALQAGQFLHVPVSQQGIDVVVKLFGPDNQQIAEVNNLRSEYGSEPVSVIAKTSGGYRLEVQSQDKKTARGRYQIRIAALRSATPKDLTRLSAERIDAEAARLVEQGTAESLRKALEKFQEALPLWRSVGDPQQEAQSLNDIGSMHNLLGENSKSFEYYAQALPLLRTQGDRGSEATTLSNMGWAYYSSGEYRKALEHLNQALLLWRTIGDRLGEADTLNTMGLAYFSLGENQEALGYFNQALPLKRAVGDKGGEGNALNSLGMVYSTLGEQQKALDYFEQSLVLERAVDDRQGVASTLSNMAKVYQVLGDKQKSLRYYGEALPMLRAIGDRFGEAITLNNIGTLYNSTGESRTALGSYSQSLAIFQAIGNRASHAKVLSNLGNAYISLGEFQKALECLKQALTIQQAIGDKFNEPMTLRRIALVERDQGHLLEARARIERALELIESTRAKFIGQELRVSYLATKQDFYEFYIDLLMRLHQLKHNRGYVEEALGANERRRARGLLDSLIEARADIRQGVPPEVLERGRSLQQKLNAVSEKQIRLLSGKHTEEQAAALAKEVNEATTEYQQVLAQIRQSSPRYAALTQPVSLSATEIQQQVLDEDTLLLEYALGGERSYLWAVTPTSVKSFELPKRADVEAAAKRVYEALTARNKTVRFEKQEKRRARIAQADDEYLEASAALSQMLLGPLAGQLGRKRLLIVSEGALQYVPFGALPIPTHQLSENRLRQQAPRTASYRPLIEEHEILSLPSASVLAVLRKEWVGRQRGARTVVVLADPVFHDDDPRVKQSKTKEVAQADVQSSKSTGMRGMATELERSARDTGEVEFRRLPYSRREAEAIVALTPKGMGMIALDFDSSRATATSTALSDYRIVHFATHGLLNSQHPELSGIVLSLVDDAGRPQDGFLRLHEIYNLKLEADLVVLSACRTALGKEIKGEGLMGLTRGFMYAGSPRVIASLWAVDDEVTAELMKQFYREMLIKGQRPAAALRAAQVSVWKEKRLPPYYWAAFVLQGEWK